MTISYAKRNNNAAAVEDCIRVVIVDDQRIIREALGLLLEREPKLNVVGGASNREEALAIVIREKPDVVLLDIDLKDDEGLDFLPELRISAPESRILILTGAPNSEAHDRAIHRGAFGIVLKDKAPETLIKAIERVCAGEVWLDRSAI